jgi:uncharacterized membrane protein YphA (DoxX/SURF4 family)
MSTSPQSMRPPMPPQPPRPSSNIVAIALLVLALIVLVSGIAVWTGLKFLSHDLRLQLKGMGAVTRKFQSTRRSDQLKSIMMSTRTAWVYPSSLAQRK